MARRARRVGRRVEGCIWRARMRAVRVRNAGTTPKNVSLLPILIPCARVDGDLKVCSYNGINVVFFKDIVNRAQDKSEEK